MLKISEKTRNIFIFLGVFILFCIIFYCFYEILPMLYPNGFRVFKHCYHGHDIGYIFYHYLKIFICFFLHYLPTVLFLKFIFNKIKDVKKRMWYIALAFPLTNLVYGVLDLFVGQFILFIPIRYNLITGFYYYTIGSTMFYYSILLLYILPSVLFTALILPKKYLPLKPEICKTTLLTILVSTLPFFLFILIMLIISCLMLIK